jgi:hypothetical protein
LAKRVGSSAATVWRHLNPGRSTTLTEAHRYERLALVCDFRLRRGWSIRRIASDLHVSRSAVERDVRRVGLLQQMGYEPIEIVRHALAEAGLSKARSRD